MRPGWSRSSRYVTPAPILQPTKWTRSSSSASSRLAPAPAVLLKRVHRQSSGRYPVRHHTGQHQRLLLEHKLNVDPYQIGRYAGRGTLPMVARPIVATAAMWTLPGRAGIRWLSERWSATVAGRRPRLVAAQPAGPQDRTMARAAPPRAVADPGRLRELVAMLPAPRVRSAGPAAMESVDAMILDAFTSAGWPAELRPFDVPVPGVNVVATREGNTRDAVVVVAHHDTVPGSGGADDNGSGVAGLVELARLLAPVRLRRTVVLAAVDHEESGLLGSQHLVRDLIAARRVVGAFVFEMLGYADPAPGSQRLPAGFGLLYPRLARRLRRRGLRGDFIAVIHRRSSQRLAATFSRCLREVAGPAAAVPVRAPGDVPVLGSALARIVPLVRNFARSDHVSFWQAGVPAIQLTDTANFRNPHYHLPGDTPDTLDYGLLADVVTATARAIEGIAAGDQSGRADGGTAAWAKRWARGSERGR